MKFFKVRVRVDLQNAQTITDKLYERTILKWLEKSEQELTSKLVKRIFCVTLHMASNQLKSTSLSEFE